jgi:hypothetical protein
VTDTYSFIFIILTHNGISLVRSDTLAITVSEIWTGCFKSIELSVQQPTWYRENCKITNSILIYIALVSTHTLGLSGSRERAQQHHNTALG